MECEPPSRSGHTAQRDNMHGNDRAVDSGIMGGMEAYHSLAGNSGPHSDHEIRCDTSDTSNALMGGASATGGEGG